MIRLYNQQASPQSSEKASVYIEVSIISYDVFIAVMFDEKLFCLLLRSRVD